MAIFERHHQMKFQAPSTPPDFAWAKSRRAGKFQTIPNDQNPKFKACFEFQILNLFVIWDLEFGNYEVYFSENLSCPR